MESLVKDATTRPPPTDIHTTLLPTSLTKPKVKIVKVDRSAAAIAMADLRRAARKTVGPGPRERNEMIARELERTGGAIEEHLSGENMILLKKAEDFGQSRAGDQRFASEANSAVVRLQRALWYVDGLMRGATIDKISTVQDQRVAAAKKRLAQCICELDNFGVQRVLLMRANWVLSKFQKWGIKHRRQRREKKIAKFKTIIPDDWMKKTIQRNYNTVETEVERDMQVDDALERLSKLRLTNDRESSSSTGDEDEDEDEDAEAEEDRDERKERKKMSKKHDWFANDGHTLSDKAQSTADAIVVRRAARKKRERDRKRQKKKDRLATMRDVESLAKLEHHMVKKSRRLHRSMAHVVARPPTPEDRWDAGMYSDYEEYDRTLYNPDNNELQHNLSDEDSFFDDSSSIHIHNKEKEEEEEEEEEEENNNDGLASTRSGASSNLSSSIPIVKKTKIFSQDEVLAMRAETDFGEDVATFLDGSGLVKNTGPAARVKFVRMMKTSYLDIRTKNLKRTKRVIGAIKKIKSMLRRVLLMPTDDDKVPGQPKLPDAVTAAAEAAVNDIDPDDIDALLDAKSVGMDVKREADVDIFKRWAGKEVVKLEPLLFAAIEGRVSVSTLNIRHDGNAREDSNDSNGMWICKVCMQTNDENALVCVVCGRPPNAPATSWGLAKHRPRRTHPRFMYTWNQKTGQTIRQWEKEEQEKIRILERSGRKLTMTEELKEKFYLRADQGGVVKP
jgi:hypothetical protein